MIVSSCCTTISCAGTFSTEQAISIMTSMIWRIDISEILDFISKTIWSYCEEITLAFSNVRDAIEKTVVVESLNKLVTVLVAIDDEAIAESANYGFSVCIADIL